VAGFVDEAQLHVKGGDGGAGAVAFRREAHVPLGGPDGGDGGDGGDVWLVASTSHASLLAFQDQPYRKAGDGRHGQGKRRHGARGADLEVPVPVGTTVKDRDGSVLADLAVAGDRWRAARGGRGGQGNARFASARRRAPDFAEQGEPGEDRWLRLELRLVADVALVGLPNVGKSTLISRVSAARPKVADYPFTTLRPHLGVVRVGEGPKEVEFVLADVPGLVEGAAEGRGLGHRFLRHVERARVLCLLLDLADGVAPPPAAQADILLRELGRYQPELLARPRVLVGSRADLAGDPTPPPGVELVVSAVRGTGLPALLTRLAELVEEARAAEGPGPRPPLVVYRPLEQDLVVEPAGPGRWVVGGAAASRAVALSDLTSDQALELVERRLRRLGVERALRRAGAQDGDEVVLGPLQFTYHRDDVVVPVPKQPSRRKDLR
jgi:GTP-binding protein